MRVLFGAEHDGLHVDPDRRGAYEWWYFDALSDDGNLALVAIYFLGAPMSPYFARHHDGKPDTARKWSGVSFSLRERTGRNRWVERAYAYNLYPTGSFTDAGVATGHSAMVRERAADGVTTWHLRIDEPNLWIGNTRARLTFRDLRPELPPNAALSDSAHTWVCAAPICAVAGEIGGRSFVGTGYHDHNFGMLPWNDVLRWYWMRAHVEAPDRATRALILYHHVGGSGENASFCVDIGGAAPKFAPVDVLESGIVRSAYGLEHATEFETSHPEIGVARWRFRNASALSEGPFYRRLPAELSIVEPDLDARATGIGEVFAPGRMLGPIVRKAIHTRLRRRAG